MESQPGSGQPPADGDFDVVWIDLTPAEAMAGAVRVVTVAPDNRPVTVQIPAGIGDQMAFRMPGAGNMAPGGGQPRDLVVRVRVLNAPPYPPQQPYPAYGSQPPQQPYPPYGAQSPQQPYPPYGAPQQPYPPPGVPPAAGASGRKRLWVGVGAAALTLVLVAGCCAGSWLLSDDDDDNEAARPLTGRTGASAEAATPVTAERYQQLLNELDRALAGGFAGVQTAKDPARIETAADGLEQLVREETAKLNTVTPPAVARDAHGALVSALGELALAADETASAAEAYQVCAGSAATALVSRSTAVQRVRTAAQSLATADPAQAFKVGSFLPKLTRDTNRRLRNGAYIVQGRGGSGQLKIDNGGRPDMVVSLVKNGAKKPVTTVYLRGKGKHTVRGVRDGTYQVFLASGVDWDGKTRRFTRNCGFSKFDDTLKFTTTSSQYTIWSITLTAVPGGNAQTSDVNPDAFPGE